MMGKYIDVIKRIVIDPNYRFLRMADLGLYDRMDDETYLRKRFKAATGDELHLDNPVTFNEKLQWIKLFDRNPLYTELVDKIKVKDYVAKKIGQQYIIPTIATWNSPNEIDFEQLPDQFVLKCNHNSGTGMFICKDKSKINKKTIRRGLKKGLKEDKYKLAREWPYKNVQRMILAEKYMEDSLTGELRDYKFFCFNGEVKALFIASDRQTRGEETKFDFYDADFNHLNLINGHPNSSKIIDKPFRFELMKMLASELSKGFPEVRVDFYEVKDKIYFGELTFFHWSGFVKFNPEKWDIKFGEWIKLPKP